MKILDIGFMINLSHLLCITFDKCFEESLEKKMKNAIALTVLLVFAFAVCGAGQDAPAKDLFASKCAACHGPDGSAQTTMARNLKIRDFHSLEVQKQTDADLKTVITKGKEKMPAFESKLTGEQIDQLVGYIRQIGKQK